MFKSHTRYADGLLTSPPLQTAADTIAFPCPLWRTFHVWFTLYTVHVGMTALAVTGLGIWNIKITFWTNKYSYINCFCWSQCSNQIVFGLRLSLFNRDENLILSALVCCWSSVSTSTFLNVCLFDGTAVQGEWKCKVYKVTPPDRPKSLCNGCVIKHFVGVFVLSFWLFKFSVGVGDYVIGLSQIYSFFLL